MSSVRWDAEIAEAYDETYAAMCGDGWCVTRRPTATSGRPSST
jgi:hypothetical protein